METIISNLQTPSWWFTGLFFVFLIFVFQKASQYVPKLMIGFIKKRKLQRLKVYRKLRYSQASITLSIIKAHSYFVIFIAVCCMYLVWFTSSQMSGLLKTDPLLFIFLTLPIYIAELAWLLKDKYAEGLVLEHNKVLQYSKK